ncbi:MAG: DUF4493 domain-containing protein [Muribaculaceae bacterium]|nr:DUF4493 domain-containing protein [Muribaculaceae bacterium]
MNFKKFNGPLSMFALVATLMATSCANEAPWSSQERADGKINLNLVTDSSVVSGSRADDDADSYAMQVDPANFSVSLVSSDNSYNRTWESLEAFNKTDGFPQGVYTLSAFYGNINTEGFECPYYEGQTDVSVRLGDTTSKTLTATLANAMVSVRYSEDFASLYPNGYSAEVQTTGHTAVAYVNRETRPAYFAPGMAQLYINLTNRAGQTVKVNPTSLNLSAKHHYVVTVGVTTGEKGNKAMDIHVSENIIEEDPIEINLTDELFTTEAPSVVAKGFISETPIEFWAHELEIDEAPEFHVMALAGLASAELTLTAANGAKVPTNGSDSYTVQLINASASDQALLASAKVECSGFFTNQGEFGVINFKEYLNNLNQGDYSASLIVKDKLGRTSAVQEDLQVLKAIVKAIDYSIVGYEKPEFLDNKIKITIKSNCEKLAEKNFKFNATDGEGVNATVGKVLSSTPGDAEGEYKYELEISTSTINDNQWTVQVQYADLKELLQVVDVKLPEFTVLTDPFAMRVKIKFENAEPGKAELIANNINIYDGRSTLSSNYVDRSQAKDGIIVVTGLEQQKTYSGWKAYLGLQMTDTYQGTEIPSFQTEEANKVPNGDFETLRETYNISSINQGGEWGVSKGVYYQNTAKYTIHEPVNWASTNTETMTGTNNTWYRQPSVFNSNLSYNSHNRGTGASSLPIGAGDSTPDSYQGFGSHSGDVSMVIRNVAWDPSGEKLTDWYKTKIGFDDYYNHDVPNISKKTVGKMFLATFSDSSNPVVTQEGCQFNSRPLFLKGWYKYSPDLNELDEYGVVSISLLSESGEEISKGTSYLTPSDQFTEFSIPLDYNFNCGKSALLKISFSSSYHENGETITVTIYISRYESYQHGATLVVDDLEFMY